jgi:hypothetical protein
MDDQPTTGSVQLIVDYSDGCRKYFDNLPWKADMSVADVLTAAKSTRIGLEFITADNGATILSIDGFSPPKEPHFVCDWLIYLNMNQFSDVKRNQFPAGTSILVKVVNTQHQ